MKKIVLPYNDKRPLWSCDLDHFKNACTPSQVGFTFKLAFNSKVISEKKRNERNLHTYKYSQGAWTDNPLGSKTFH